VNNAARRYNDLKVLCDRRATELKEKLDELDSLKLDHEAMENMKFRNTFEAQRIDHLKVVRFPSSFFRHHSASRLQRKLKRWRMISSGASTTEDSSTTCSPASKRTR
jgi:hypothetical protein